MIHLVTVNREIEEDVEFGTCDYCMFTSDHVYEVLHFRDDSGDLFIDNGNWSWGYWYVRWHIDNYIRLGQFFEDHPLDGPLTEENVSAHIDRYMETI